MFIFLLAFLNDFTFLKVFFSLTIFAFLFCLLPLYLWLSILSQRPLFFFSHPFFYLFCIPSFFFIGFLILFAKYPFFSLLIFRLWLVSCYFVPSLSFFLIPLWQCCCQCSPDQQDFKYCAISAENEIGKQSSNCNGVFYYIHALRKGMNLSLCPAVHLFGSLLHKWAF